MWERPIVNFDLCTRLGSVKQTSAQQPSGHASINVYMVWSQIFHGLCKYRKCTLGVTSHAPLSEGAGTRTSSINVIIVCGEKVNANVIKTSSSITVPAVNICEVCLWL